MRTWLFAAAVNGFLAVAAGAFAAHGLSGRLTPEALAWFETGARYEAYHALALLGVAWLADRETAGKSRLIAVAGWSFVVGIGLFSGSLYLLALTGARWLGAITPLGGVGFLTGWATLALYSVSKRR